MQGDLQASVPHAWKALAGTQSPARRVRAQAFPQQFPPLGYDGAAMLAQQYKAALERARQQRLNALVAQLSNGTLPGFSTVRALPPCAAGGRGCLPTAAVERAMQCVMCMLAHGPCFAARIMHATCFLGQVRMRD